MEISILTNRVFGIGQSIETKIADCHEFNIATAFIDSSMISILTDSLKRNKGLITGRLLIGLYGCLNRKEDLETLHNLAHKHADNISIRISKNKQFHWKYYSFKRGSIWSTFIGSANFTKAGMGTNAEVMTEIKYKKNENSNLNAEFDKEWDDAGSIIDFNIGEYEEANLIYSSGKTGNNAFFNKQENPQSRKISSEKAFALYLAETCSVATNRKIENLKPEWANTSYFVLPGLREYNLCKEIGRILIFERLSKGKYNVFWARYKDDTITKTEDGKYFVAYDIYGKIKSLNSIIIEQLQYDSGLNIQLTGWSKNWMTYKVLGKNQTKILSEILKLDFPN